MKKKLCLSIFSFFLAVLMAVVSPAQVIADSTNKQYIKEIRIGYGEDGKEQLKKAGYTVWENLNANDGGNGNAVYLGYITTNHKEEAITDVAVMPMGKDGDRAYSFEAYTKEMENLSKQIDTQLENFDAAISEFRDNLQKPAPYNDYALRAYTMLNMYIEDDTGMPVGRLFAQGQFPEYEDEETGKTYEDTTDEFMPFDNEISLDVYHNILMMGNSMAVKAIQVALALGCTTTGDLDDEGEEILGETFLDKIANTPYIGEYPTSMNQDLTTVSNTVTSFREELLAAKSTYEYAQSYEGGKSAYINALIENSEDYSIAISRITLIEAMQSTSYGGVSINGEELSFLDVMLLPTTVGDPDDPVLDSNLLSHLVMAMTPGQIAMSEYVGLSSLVQNAYSTTQEKIEGDDGLNHYPLSIVDTYLAELDQIEAVSVYLGVDRTVFSDYKTVAITSQAIRDQTINNGLGVTADYDSTSGSTFEKKKALLISAGVSGAVGVGLVAYAATHWNQINYVDITMNVPKLRVKYVVLQISAGDVALPEGFDPYGTIDSTPDELLNAISQRTGEYAKVRFEDSSVLFEEGKWTQFTKTYTTSIGTKVAAVAGALFLAAGVALAIVGFLQKNGTPEPAKVDYDPIPRAIIDVKAKGSTGDSLYVTYYAAKLAATKDDAYLTEEDTTKLYGDLNGLNTIEPWLCLYYARDLRLGSPLTSTMLVKASDDRTDAQKKTYLPVHDFFNNELTANNQGYAPFSLNQTSQKKNAPSILVFFKRDLTVNPIAATIMENSTLLIAAGTFIAGAGITFAVTWIVARRKIQKSLHVKA